MKSFEQKEAKVAKVGMAGNQPFMSSAIFCSNSPSFLNLGCVCAALCFLCPRNPLRHALENGSPRRPPTLRKPPTRDRVLENRNSVNQQPEGDSGFSVDRADKLEKETHGGRQCVFPILLSPFAISPLNFFGGQRKNLLAAIQTLPSRSEPPSLGLGLPAIFAITQV
jgi:hypothetical protein